MFSLNAGALGVKVVHQWRDAMLARKRCELLPIDGLHECTFERLALLALEIRPDACQDHLPLKRQLHWKPPHSSAHA